MAKAVDMVEMTAVTTAVESELQREIKWADRSEQGLDDLKVHSKVPYKAALMVEMENSTGLTTDSKELQKVLKRA